MNFDPMLDFLANGLLRFTWWQVLLYTLAATHLTIAAVTIYLHRSQAHRAVDLHPAISHVFRMWLWLSTGMVTKEWAAIHRKHHARCETEGDPHSPVVFGIKKVLLEGSELYRAESKVQETMDKYGHGTPDDWIERNLYTRWSFAGVYITLVVNFLLFGFLGLTVFAVQMIWIPITAAGIINGIGHWWGYRNFDAPDASRNIVPWGILIGGEELHNNHHAFGTSAKLSNKWYEFDIGWMYICIFRFFGMAHVKKVAPVAKFQVARSQIDFDTVQAVIRNRYDLMAAYARGLKKEARAEIAKLEQQGQSDRSLVALAKRWAHLESTQWPEQHRAKLHAFCANSDALRKLTEMRAELNQMWERSTATREQLQAQLQTWVHNAELSGVKALQDVSKRLRSYA
jgi:stearoyl-CoA desaturase (Delta-9 desaturase)